MTVEIASAFRLQLTERFGRHPPAGVQSISNGTAMNSASKHPADANAAKTLPETPAAQPPAGNDGRLPDGMPQFVTKLAPLEEQVGMHVIAALQHPKTFAVLTTVAADGSGSQQIVSIPLDANRFEQIQKLLAASQPARKQRVQCVGFHCHFEDDNAADEEGADDE
jgi:hypothetical protein